MSILSLTIVCKITLKVSLQSHRNSNPCRVLMGETHTRESSWWRHQMETFSALLALCAGNSPINVEFPAQRPVTRSFDVFFDLRLNKRLSKQSWGWWFETLPRPLGRHSNVKRMDLWIEIGVGVGCEDEFAFSQIVWYVIHWKMAWSWHLRNNRKLHGLIKDKQSCRKLFQLMYSRVNYHIEAWTKYTDCAGDVSNCIFFYNIGLKPPVW